MKAKLFIIGFLIAALLFAFTFKGHSQEIASSVFRLPDTVYTERLPIDEKCLIADETWITYTKTGAKITSYSEAAFTDISLKFGHKFKRISINYKSDRHGPYKEYCIYLSQELANNIKEWAKTNL